VGKVENPVQSSKRWFLQNWTTLPCW